MGMTLTHPSVEGDPPPGPACGGASPVTVPRASVAARDLRTLASVLARS